MWDGPKGKREEARLQPKGKRREGAASTGRKREGVRMGLLDRCWCGLRERVKERAKREKFGAFGPKQRGRWFLFFLIFFSNFVSMPFENHFKFSLSSF